MDVSLVQLAATRLADSAAVLEARALRLRVHATHTGWQSPAARAFTERLNILVAELLARSAEIDEVAERFRARAAFLAGLS